MLEEGGSEGENKIKFGQFCGHVVRDRGHGRDRHGAALRGHFRYNFRWLHNLGHYFPILLRCPYNCT